LLTWAGSLGNIQRAGVEGTGAYGAGLVRAIARTVLSGNATATPKSQTGVAEALCMLSVARHSAVKARTQTINQLRSLLISAPDDLRERLWKTKLEHLMRRLIIFDKSVSETSSESVWSRTTNGCDTYCCSRR